MFANQVKRLFAELDARRQNVSFITSLTEFIKLYPQFANAMQQHDSQEALDCMETELCRNFDQQTLHPETAPRTEFVKYFNDAVFRYTLDGEQSTFVRLDMNPAFGHMFDSLEALLGGKKFSRVPPVLQFCFNRFSSEVVMDNDQPQTITQKITRKQTFYPEINLT